MGQRGARPLPANVLEMRGSNKARRAPPVPKGLPKPTCSKKLHPFAQRCHRETIARLRVFGLLHQVNPQSIEVYADAYARWRIAAEAIAQLEAPGMLMATPSGHQQKSVFEQILKATSAQMSKLDRDFGFPQPVAGTPPEPKPDAQPETSKSRFLT